MQTISFAEWKLCNFMPFHYLFPMILEPFSENPYLCMYFILPISLPSHIFSPSPFISQVYYFYHFLPYLSLYNFPLFTFMTYIHTSTFYTWQQTFIMIIVPSAFLQMYWIYSSLWLNKILLCICIMFSLLYSTLDGHFLAIVNNPGIKMCI